MDDFDDRFGADCQVKVINHQKWVNINKSVQGRPSSRSSLVAAAVDWLDRDQVGVVRVQARLPAGCCWNVGAGWVELGRRHVRHTRRDAARDGIIFSALACSPIHPRKTNGVVDHEPME